LLKENRVENDLRPDPNESRSDFLWEVHKYTNEYIRFADTKAAFIAGISAALIGSLVASPLFDSIFLSTPCLWSKLQWTGIAALLLLAVSLVLSIAAIRPRLWNKTSVGYIFWGSIAGHGSMLQFTRAVHELSQLGMTNAISDHLFVLSSIAKRKYAYVDWALSVGVAGGALAGIVLFVQHATHVAAATHS
jgi:hypothetical protein